METPLLSIVDTITDLKNLAPVDRAHALLVSKASVGDNLGGFYRWDSTTTGAEDTVFMNVIPSNVSANGRWTRVFQKAKSYPGGTMVINGGVKTFYAAGTTDANGEVSLNVTDDNTSTGNALFTEVWLTTAQSTTAATAPSNGTQSYRKSLSVNLKQLVFGFFKANPITITVGLAYNPIASVGAGINVQFKIEGI